jgi:hypothetical protein
VPPFNLSLFAVGEPERVLLTSGAERGPSTAPLPAAGVAEILGPVWGGKSALVTDATGRVLARGAPDGPEAGWMAQFTREDGPIAYPLRVDLRVPGRYSVESVFFDLEDFEVPPLPGTPPNR